MSVEAKKKGKTDTKIADPNIYSIYGVLFFTSVSYIHTHNLQNIIFPLELNVLPIKIVSFSLCEEMTKSVHFQVVC